MEAGWKRLPVYYNLHKPYIPNSGVILDIGQFLCQLDYMSLDMTIPVFRVSDKVRLKPVSSAPETS